MVTSLSQANIEHPDYTKFKSRWNLIRDALAGKEDIDEAGEVYMPRPSGYSDARYAAYQRRAVYFGATGRTLAGFKGAVFRKEAEVNLPSKISYLEDDADGEGNSLVQFSKTVCADVIAQGRFGVLVDYPVSENITNLEEERQANLQAHFKGYTPESIVNWATMRKGSKTILSHVLLEEPDYNESDVFERTANIKYRLLQLDDNGEYVQRVMREREHLDPKTNKKVKTLETEENIFPTLPNGKHLDFIPFIFIGADTLTVSPDLPPLYDLAQLNIAHYNNSADWEQAVFMIGQPTPYISGCDERFIEENRGQLVIGSGSAWLLPDGSQVGMLESKSDRNIIMAAMQLKESEMIGLGARVVQDNSARGSEATESIAIRRSGEASQLACIADNVSTAMVRLFTWAAMWMDESADSIQYKLNKDFFPQRLSHQDIGALVSSWQGGAIPHSVLLDNLRDGEILSELSTNEQIIGEIEEEAPALGMMTAPTDDTASDDATNDDA